jgi:periplasmic protein TonB
MASAQAMYYGPNWILRGFIVVSAMVHLVLMLHVSGLIRVDQVQKIKVSLFENKTPPRMLPRPRPKPPEPVKTGQVKPLEVSRPVVPVPVPKEAEPARVDPARSVGESYAAGTPIALPAGGFSAPPKLSASTGLDAQPPSVYQELVRQRIERQKQYPPQARKRQEQGHVVLHFSISPRGELKDVRVVKSSRNQELDNAALEAVKKAAPYPPPPASLGAKGLAMEITIAFELT